MPSLSDNDDILYPTFDSDLRKSPMVVATFNLVATIVGGGVLSLPLAFERCGFVLATLLMLFAGYITDESLFLLCLAARKNGGTSYVHVGRDAFGEIMDWFIALLLSVFLLFVLTAYMVLLRDIWTPVVALLLDTQVHGNVVLLVILVIMSPFLIQKTLHALRFNCYVGFVSLSILCLALVHHAWITPLRTTLKLFPDSFGDALFAFPIIVLSFLSAFNVLPIQNALLEPTRGRMRRVVDLATVSCFALMYTFGLSGYLYAQDDTRGNILLNCNLHDMVFLVGRIGCGVTIALALAMMLLPCRDSLLECVDMSMEHARFGLARLSSMREDQQEQIVSTEQTTLLPLPRTDDELEPSVDDIPIIHYASTLLIVVLCYVAAVLAPGVAIVWSLCGSSMAFMIAYILPAACYLKLQSSPSWRTGLSWFLIIFSVVGGIACTSQTIIMMHWKEIML